MYDIDPEKPVDYKALSRKMRNNIKEQLPDMKPIVKFNGGNPVVLCALCRCIVKYGVDPKTAKAAICDEFEGCGE
jgi:hypothetical protein